MKPLCAEPPGQGALEAQLRYGSSYRLALERVVGLSKPPSSTSGSSEGKTEGGACRAQGTVQDTGGNRLSCAPFTLF